MSYQSYLAKYGRRKPIHASMVWESVNRVLQAGRTRDLIKVAAARALHHATMTYVLLHR